MRLASGPRCFKPEWAGLDAKVKLNANAPSISEDVLVQILSPDIPIKQQRQYVPRRSLLPTRPTRDGEHVMCLYGHAKGDVGRVVSIQSDTVMICPPRGKQTPTNSVGHKLSNVVSVKL